jgi:hypothetical protein
LANNTTLPEREAEREPADLAVDAKAFFVAARSGAKAEEDGRAAWRDNTMNLARTLLAARELHQNDTRAFGAWFKDSGLGDLMNANERAALIGMAENPGITGHILATTHRRSWELIWREDIKPEIKRTVTSARNSPSRGGRPSQSHNAPAPIQDNDPIADLACMYTDKCSDEVWRTVPKIATVLGRVADSAVRDMLKRLDGDGSLEKQRGADGVTIEFRIGGEHACTETASTPPPAKNLQHELNTALVKIAKLERENTWLIQRLDIKDRRAFNKQFPDRSRRLH